MARSQKLKVFRTPIGFHDAYVAAPSQKAALEAWGADSNLFAIGSAELVDDPDLTREPLADPGKVIKRVRGSLADHMAALPKRASTKSEPTPPAPSDRKKTVKTAPRKPKPRPSRAALDRAEKAIEVLETRQTAEMNDFDERQAKLDRERAQLKRKHERDLTKVQTRATAAREKLEAAMQGWRDDE